MDLSLVTSLLLLKSVVRFEAVLWRMMLEGVILA